MSLQFEESFAKKESVSEDRTLLLVTVSDAFELKCDFRSFYIINNDALD